MAGEWNQGQEIIPLTIIPLTLCGLPLQFL